MSPLDILIVGKLRICEYKIRVINITFNNIFFGVFFNLKFTRSASAKLLQLRRKNYYKRENMSTINTL